MTKIKIRHVKCPDCGGETFSSFNLPKDTKWFKCLNCGALLKEKSFVGVKGADIDGER